MDSGAIRRKAALGMALLTTAGLLAVAGTAPAEAASPCSGRRVRTLHFTTGSTQVFRHGDYVCALTYPKKKTGRKTMSVSVQARGSRPVVDKGSYTHHAGPVTVHAGHRCVWLKGRVSSGSVSSGWILC